MMMSSSTKPEEEKEGEKLVPPAPLKTQAAAESVKDLERRLQLMAQAELNTKPAPSKPAAAKPAPKVAPPAVAQQAGGKNALLVR